MYILKINLMLDGKEYKKGDILPKVPESTMQLLEDHNFIKEMHVPEDDGKNHDAKIEYYDEKTIRAIKSKKKLKEYAAAIGMELHDSQPLEKMQDEIINFIEEKEAGVL